MVRTEECGARIGVSSVPGSGESDINVGGSSEDTERTSTLLKVVGARVSAAPGPTRAHRIIMSAKTLNMR